MAKQDKNIKNQVVRQRNGRSYYRAKVLEVLGGKCIKCGFDDLRALQVDHVNGDGYKVKRLRGNGETKNSNDLRTAWFKSIVDGESHDGQLLCANCHAIKTFENKEYKPIQQRSQAVEDG